MCKYDIRNRDMKEYPGMNISSIALSEGFIYCEEDVAFMIGVLLMVLLRKALEAMMKVS